MANELGIKVVAKTDGASSALVMLGNTTDREAKRMQAALKLVNEALKQQATAAKATSESAGYKQMAEGAAKAAISQGQLNNALRQTPSQFTDIFVSLASGQQPITVLLQQGSQLRDMFGGFGNMFRGLASFITPTTLALTGVAAAAGALTYAFTKGSAQEAEFRKGLLLTGNYAGVTAGNFERLVASVNAYAKVGAGASRVAGMAVVNTGAFGPGLIEDATKATALMEKVTGDSADKVAADFAKMQDGVAKWAAEHNKSMHFMSAAQYEQIKSLEDAGRAQEAQKIVLDALNERLSASSRQVEGYAGYWDQLKKAVSDAGDALAQFGKGATVDTELARIQQRMKDIQAIKSGGQLFLPKIGESFDIDKTIAGYAQLIAKLQESKAVGEQVAAATAASQKIHGDAIKASGVVERLTQEYNARDKVKKQIEEYTSAVAKMRAAGSPAAPSEAEEARVIAEIKRRNQTPADNRLEGAIRETDKALTEELVKIKASTDYWLKYGKQLDDSRAAVIRFRTEQGDLKGAAPAVKARLIGEAESVDAAKRTQMIAEETDAIQTRLKAIQADAAARETSQKALFIEAETQKILGDKIDQTSAAYASLRAAAQAAAATLYENTRVNPALQTNDRNADHYLQGLKQEIDLIGKDSLARQQFAEILKLEAQMRKDIAQYPEDAGQFVSQFERNRERIKQGLAESYAAQRSWEAGTADTFAKYIENAGNAADQAASRINGSFSRMEDALVEFAHTGQLNLGKLFQFMADEFIRQQARMVIAQGVSGYANGGGWGGAFSAIGSLFGLGSTSSATAPNAGMGGNFDEMLGVVGARAGGGSVRAGSTYLVGEEGPELFTAAQTGQIIPNRQTQDLMSGSALHLTINQSVGEFVTPSQATNLARQTADTVVARVRDGLRNNRL